MWMYSLFVFDIFNKFTGQFGAPVMFNFSFFTSHVDAAICCYLALFCADDNPLQYQRAAYICSCAYQ